MSFQPAIPCQVALQHCLSPLHQPESLCCLGNPTQGHLRSVTYVSEHVLPMSSVQRLTRRGFKYASRTNYGASRESVTADNSVRAFFRSAVSKPSVNQE